MGVGWSLAERAMESLATINSSGPAVPHLMILKGKCEIVEMLMGLGAPSKANPVFPKTPEQGWEVSGTSEGCL